MIGQFEAQSDAEIHARLPHLGGLAGIELFKPPFLVVLFGMGKFQAPGPIWGGWGAQDYVNKPHSVLCLVHDGNVPEFYADGDTTGFVATP